jgi:methionine-rich copper-binding protein CopC
MNTFIAKTAALLFAAAPLVLVGSGAQAAAKLVSETPAADATVAAPQKIQLQFNERLNPRLSDANLMTESGSPIPVTNSADGMTIVATPKTVLEPGRYKVLWRAVDSAGARSRDVFDFVVR